MVRRTAARVLVPLALIAVGLGVYLIVHTTISHHADATAAQTTTTTVVNGVRKPAKHHHLARFWVVRSGNTLSSIADRSGVPLAKILSLNPSLSGEPNSLQTGKRLRLR